MRNSSCKMKPIYISWNVYSRDIPHDKPRAESRHEENQVKKFTRGTLQVEHNRATVLPVVSSMKYRFWRIDTHTDDRTVIENSTTQLLALPKKNGCSHMAGKCLHFEKMLYAMSTEALAAEFEYYQPCAKMCDFLDPAKVALDDDDDDAGSAGGGACKPVSTQNGAPLSAKDKLAQMKLLKESAIVQGASSSAASSSKPAPSSSSVPSVGASAAAPSSKMKKAPAPKKSAKKASPKKAPVMKRAMKSKKKEERSLEDGGTLFPEMPDDEAEEDVDEDDKEDDLLADSPVTKKPKK